MSEIRTFRGNHEYIKPVKTKQQTGQTDKKGDLLTRIWRHRLTVFYRVLLVLIAVVTVVVICVIRFNNKVYTGYRVVSETSWSDNSSIAVQAYHDNILAYSKDGAVCTDLKGKMLWNQSYEMQNPLVAVCGEYVAIGDYNGTTIYVMNLSGQQGTIHTRMPIRAIRVSEKGTVMAILDDTPVTQFHLYNKDGEILWGNKSTMPISGYPVDACVSGNSVLVGVSYLYADSGILTSRVAFYNLGDVGDNYPDTLVSSFKYDDAIVPVLRFMNEEDSFAVADNRLMFYSGKQIPTSTKEIILSEEVRAVFYNESYVGLVFSNVTGATKYKLSVYNTSGRLVHTYEFNQEFKEILFYNHLVYIYNEKECLIYTLKGMRKFEGEFDIPVQVLIPTTAADKLILVGKKKIQNIKLY